MEVMLQSAQQDIQTERETYQQSRQGLDVMYQEVKKKLQDETQMRLVCFCLYLSVCPPASADAEVGGQTDDQSVCPPVCPSVRPSTRLSICPSICPSVCPTVCRSVSRSICSTARPFVRPPPARAFIHPTIRLSVCPSVHSLANPPVCSSVHLSLARPSI